MRENAYINQVNNNTLTLAPDDFFDRLVWHSIPEWGIDESHFEEALMDIEDGYRTYESVAVEWGVYIITLKFIMKRMWVH